MSGRTRIKICGLRSEADVAAAVEAGADAVGFVFAPSSPRFIEPQAAADLACLLPPFVQAVGLFVDRPVVDVLAMAEDACIDLVQLHGREDQRTIDAVREHWPVIRAIRFSPEAIARWGPERGIDVLLVDGSEGGAAQCFDWRALAAQRDSIRSLLMIAGGLTAENVGEAIRTVRPFAVDVSSGVERERGVKDPALIRAFCRAVREADSAPNAAANLA